MFGMCWHKLFSELRVLLVRFAFMSEVDWWHLTSAACAICLYPLQNRLWPEMTLTSYKRKKQILLKLSWPGGDTTAWQLWWCKPHVRTFNHPIPLEFDGPHETAVNQIDKAFWQHRWQPDGHPNHYEFRGGDGREGIGSVPDRGGGFIAGFNGASHPVWWISGVRRESCAWQPPFSDGFGANSHTAGLLSIPSVLWLGAWVEPESGELKTTLGSQVSTAADGTKSNIHLGCVSYWCASLNFHALLRDASHLPINQSLPVNK